MKNGDFNSDVFSLKVYKGKTRFVSYFKNTIMPTLIYGFFIGVVVGVVVFGFNLMSEFLVEQSKEIYFYVSQHLQYLPVLLLGLAVLGFFSYLIAKLVPDSQGSGIPYTEGVMQGKIKFQPTEMAGAISSSAYLTFAGGLPLGGEGPSVTLGGVLGLFVNRAGQKAFKRGKEYERMSVTSGASAGLAVAFNAPLTGILVVKSHADDNKFRCKIYKGGLLSGDIKSEKSRKGNNCIQIDINSKGTFQYPGIIY